MSFRGLVLAAVVLLTFSTDLFATVTVSQSDNAFATGTSVCFSSDDPSEYAGLCYMHQVSKLGPNNSSELYLSTLNSIQVERSDSLCGSYLRDGAFGCGRVQSVH